MLTTALCLTIKFSVNAVKVTAVLLELLGLENWVLFDFSVPPGADPSAAAPPHQVHPPANTQRAELRQRPPHLRPRETADSLQAGQRSWKQLGSICQGHLQVSLAFCLFCSSFNFLPLISTATFIS